MSSLILLIHHFASLSLSVTSFFHFFFQHDHLQYPKMLFFDCNTLFCFYRHLCKLFLLYWIFGAHLFSPPSQSLSDDDHHDFQRVDPVLGINFASTSELKYFECIIVDETISHSNALLSTWICILSAELDLKESSLLVMALWQSFYACRLL